MHGSRENTPYMLIKKMPTKILKKISLHNTRIFVPQFGLKNYFEYGNDTPYLNLFIFLLLINDKTNF